MMHGTYTVIHRVTVLLGSVSAQLDCQCWSVFVVVDFVTCADMSGYLPPTCIVIYLPQAKRAGVSRRQVL